MDIGRLEIVVHEVTFSLSRIEIGRNTTSLASGDAETFTFIWKARPSAQSIRVEVLLGQGSVDQVPEDNVASRPIYVIPAKIGPGPSPVGRDGPYVPAGAALAGALGFGTLAGLLIFLVNTDLFRYPFFFTLYPLYSKLRPETLLSNRLRKRIYVYVQNNPGEHFRSILVKLNLTNGTLAHHLYTLEKEALIRSEKDGLYRRFYPAGYHLTDGASRLSPIQRSILDCIEKRPGLSQKDISDQLGMSSSTVNYNVKVLEE
jgi:DNA-binding MarR family transcriptional regulator